MAKWQTRKSISVKKDTYERIRAYCQAEKMSMSQLVEREVGKYLDAEEARKAG